MFRYGSSFYAFYFKLLLAILIPQINSEHIPAILCIHKSAPCLFPFLLSDFLFLFLFIFFLIFPKCIERL